ncbi:3-hydroxy-2-methylbutyryl-CoA dehydrogenase [Chromatiales bacterium (ex Bugula neritina AB1)]|nr:3-hydroxy-2-methylbutyryl-CoA dehydrogenase [Chromatiales bacterium (ex Bugula neritina AB1)]
MNVSGLSAIVTGGGSGLGAATVKSLCEQGMKVAALDVNQQALDAITSETGALGLLCDVADEDSPMEALSRAQKQHGVARLLVNCAGIGVPQRIVSRDGASPLSDFKKIIDINLVGTYNMIRLFAEQLIPADALDENGERGVIVNTASVAAYDGQIGQAAYSASKGGIVALNLVAAREFASFGIRSMTIAPGLMATPMLLGLPEEAQVSLAGQVPFPKRLGHPDEYASLVLEICRNQLLNGEVIRMDGAIRMAPK